MFQNQVTPKAETCLVNTVAQGKDKEGDIVVELDGFKAYLKNAAFPFLGRGKKSTTRRMQMGGQLTIRSPNRNA